MTTPINTLPDIKYRLYIDDERYPSTPDWLIARSSLEATLMIQKYGLPYHIAFDHDLRFDINGGECNVITFIDWFSDKIVSYSTMIPSSFSYSIHSSNPDGARKIKLKMDELLHLYQE